MARSKSHYKAHTSQRKKKSRFKSGLEAEFAKKAFSMGIPRDYEPDTFAYQILSHYTPDFRIRRNFYVETKGYFSPSNRGRLLCFREQHPDITIYLVFQAPNNKLSSKSKTTYAEWAEKHGFKWCGIKDVQKGMFA